MRPRRDLPALGPEGSARQTTMFVVALLVAMLFAPVAARAAGTLVSIVDPSTGAKAHVSNGQLHVGDGTGPLTVNGTVKATFPNPQPIAGTVNVKNTAGAPLHVSVENTVGAPVPINGAVTVTDTLDARQALPESPWRSFGPANNGETINLFGPAQGNVNLAVTSFTIVNGGDVKDTVAFQISPSAGGVCQSAGGGEVTEVTVAPNETAHVTYPQPLVLLLQNTCLTAHVTGNGVTKITGVGFSE